MFYEKRCEDALIIPGLEEPQCPQVHDGDSMPLSHRLYYVAKPLLPAGFRLLLRRQLAGYQKKKFGDIWPIYGPAAAPPAGWPGWPGGKRFALVLTHDVDSAGGNDRVPRLMELERSLGFTSTFFFVPRWYEHPERHHGLLRRNGFEIGVHGLKHDGKLYESEKAFNRNAAVINAYIKMWGAVGFRAPCMHHNLAWHHRLDILYDASTYDTDPFEPQGGGAGTIFPYTVIDPATGHSYVELPYTLPQDFLLYVVLRQQTIEIWKRKLDWVAARGGMVHLITHPDYMTFSDNGCSTEKYPAMFYEALLKYLRTDYEGRYWLASAKEVADYQRAWRREAPGT